MHLNKIQKWSIAISFLLFIGVFPYWIKISQDCVERGNQIKFNQEILRISDNSQNTNSIQFEDIEIIELYAPTADFISIVEQNVNFGSSINQFWWLILPSTIFLTLTSVVRSKREIRSTEVLDLRQIIYLVIEEQPGIHFKGICRKTDRKNGVVQYHLRVLENKEQLIRSHEDGGFTRYFPRTNSFSSKLSQNLLSMLQRSSAQPILELLYKNDQPLSRNTIAQKIGVTPQGVSWNTKKLIETGIIKESRVNRQKYFTLTNEALGILENLVPF